MNQLHILEQLISLEDLLETTGIFSHLIVLLNALAIQNSSSLVLMCTYFFFHFFLLGAYEYIHSCNIIIQISYKSRTIAPLEHYPSPSSLIYSAKKKNGSKKHRRVDHSPRRRRRRRRGSSRRRRRR